MLKIRKSADRGVAEPGWLSSRHSFSFGDYHDPAHMGFRALRVINEDRVAPAAGFAEHGHANMEIISYVLDGALEHKDSLGTGSVIRRGDVQRMSAGTGIRHSEYNHSKEKPVHFLQIWLLPETQNIKPGYEQNFFGDALDDELRLVASRDGRDGSLTIHQDSDLYASRLKAGGGVAHRFASGRGGWLQIAQGHVEANGAILQSGDGLAIDETNDLKIIAIESSELLLFDLA